jgi:hypothetical protein
MPFGFPSEQAFSFTGIPIMAARPLTATQMVAIAPALAAGIRPRKRPLLSASFRKGLASLARRHADEFAGKPTLKNVAARYLRALLQPHKRAGRPCDARVTTASRLLKHYRGRYPAETFSTTWNRIYPTVLPDIETLPPPQASVQKRRLRSAVRSRPNTRRRRAKAK